MSLFRTAVKSKSKKWAVYRGVEGGMDVSQVGGHGFSTFEMLPFRCGTTKNPTPNRHNCAAHVYSDKIAKVRMPTFFWLRKCKLQTSSCKLQVTLGSYDWSACTQVLLTSWGSRPGGQIYIYLGSLRSFVEAPSLPEIIFACVFRFQVNFARTI